MSRLLGPVNAAEDPSACFRGREDFLYRDHRPAIVALCASHALRRLEPASAAARRAVAILKALATSSDDEAQLQALGELSRHPDTLDAALEQALSRFDAGDGRFSSIIGRGLAIRFDLAFQSLAVAAETGTALRLAEDALAELGGYDTTDASQVCRIVELLEQIWDSGSPAAHAVAHAVEARLRRLGAAPAAAGPTLELADRIAREGDLDARRQLAYYAGKFDDERIGTERLWRRHVLLMLIETSETEASFSDILDKLELASDTSWALDEILERSERCGINLERRLVAKTWASDAAAEVIADRLENGSYEPKEMAAEWLRLIRKGETPRNATEMIAEKLMKTP